MEPMGAAPNKPHVATGKESDVKILQYSVFTCDKAENVFGDDSVRHDLTDTVNKNVRVHSPEKG